MAKIRVKNLLIRTYIGFNPDELTNKQDVIINLEIEAEIPEEARITSYNVCYTKLLRRIPVDMVILSAGLEARHDAKEVAKRFGISCSTNESCTASVMGGGVGVSGFEQR